LDTVRLAKGDKLRVDRSGLFGLVIRVDRGGTWVDVVWRSWSERHSERHRANDPLLAPYFRHEWTERDIDATRPKLEVAS
jgi:hypothetical protein